MKIVGSGIDVTTIKLVDGLAANNQYFAIGHALTNGTLPNNLDFVEVSDLTIDANLQSAGQTANLACGAIRLMGNHVRIRRVKAINWGNKLSTKTSLVLAVIMAEPETGGTMTDCGIEECIAIQLASTPSTSTVGEVLILHAGGKLVRSNGNDYDAVNELEGYGLGAFIRNCFVDCDSTGSLGNGTDYRSKFRALSMSSCKGGIIEGNQVHNTWYAGPYLTRWSARDILVRNNTFKNVVGGPFPNLPAPGTSITVSSFTLPEASPSTLVEATTSSNHPLATGDRVKITNGTDPLLNGVFIITVTAANKFRYKASSRPNPAGTGTMQKVLGVEKLLIEANVTELAPFTSGSNTPIAIQLNANSSGAQSLAYAYGDVVIRENKVRYLDGLFDATYLGYPMKVVGARNLIVRDNVIESAPTSQPALQNSLCGSVSYFNDQTPTGVLVQGVNSDQSNKKYSELATDAEDALLMTLL
jgi:hypothetical protein